MKKASKAYNIAVLCIKGVRDVSRIPRYKIRTTKFQNKPQGFKNKTSKNKPIVAEK